jgi:hypothetical protein
MRCRSADGEWQVDVIRLIATGTHRDGDWLRIRRWGCHIADVRTVDELQEYVDLADLQEGLGRTDGRRLSLSTLLRGCTIGCRRTGPVRFGPALRLVAARCPWR